VWGSEGGKVSPVLAIGGGKGGIGKSFLAANLGVALAEMGKEVILVDVDLGGANLHTFFGISYPEKSLDHLLRKKTRKMEDLLLETQIPHLRIVSGVLRHLSASNIKHYQKQKLLRHIRSLKADYVILDLGGGSSSHVLDFFIAADEGLLLITPESTSLENAYRFMRAAFFRQFRQAVTLPEARRIITLAMNHLDPALKTPYQLLEKVRELDGRIEERLTESLRHLRPLLVINQVRSREEARLGFSVKSVCQRYFGIDFHFLGYIYYDPKVFYSIQRGRPFLHEYPDTETALCFRDISQRLLIRREVELI